MFFCKRGAVVGAGATPDGNARPLLLPLPSQCLLQRRFLPDAKAFLVATLGMSHGEPQLSSKTKNLKT
jgi:hypothetical protein